MSLTNVTPIRLSTGIQLGTGDTLLFTCPAASYVKVSAAVLSNITSIAATATLNIVAAGSAVSASNQVVSLQPVTANSSYQASEFINQTLTPGDMLYGKASLAGTINFSASGALFS